MLSEIEIWYNNFVNVSSPTSVFGQVPNEAKDAQEKWIKKEYKRWLYIIHPDKCKPKNDRERIMCTEMMDMLGKLREIAVEQIRNGIYGTVHAKVKSHVSPETVIMSDKAEYRIYPEPIEGDLAHIFRAEKHEKGVVEDVCFKVVIDEESNRLLKNEADILSLVKHRLMPKLVEHFYLDDGRAVNVMNWIDGGFDLVGLRSIFPDGLPQYHLGWIAERLLGVLGYLHINSVIHGTIEPSNIIVVDNDPRVVQHHQAIIIGHSYAIANANKKGKKYAALNEFSSPEMKLAYSLGKPLPIPDPVHDMYSLGKSLLYLITPDLDDPIAALGLPDDVFDNRLKDLFLEMVNVPEEYRLNDAWEAYHQLKKIRFEVFGKKGLKHFSEKI